MPSNNIEAAKIESIFAALEVPLTRGGDWFQCACPVHHGDNKTAFGWNLKTSTWSCFTHHCEMVYGNKIVGLLKGVMNFTDEEASHWLAQNSTGVVAPSAALKIDKIYPENCLKRLFRTDFYEKRGFLRETLDNFEHGMAESGTMRNRVVFPVRDERGYIRGFSGRWAGKEAISNGKTICVSSTNKQVAKWKHTSFKKSSYLYNWCKLKSQNPEPIIVVESIANVMRFHEAGYQNVCASFGASLSVKQTSLLIKRGLPVILAYDNDEAGHKGIEKAKKKLEQYLDVRVLHTRDSRDWAELNNEEVKQICQISTLAQVD